VAHRANIFVARWATGQNAGGKAVGPARRPAGKKPTAV
jgi:hypothetical protein